MKTIKEILEAKNVADVVPVPVPVPSLNSLDDVTKLAQFANLRLLQAGTAENAEEVKYALEQYIAALDAMKRFYHTFNEAHEMECKKFAEETAAKYGISLTTVEDAVEANEITPTFEDAPGMFGQQPPTVKSIKEIRAKIETTNAYSLGAGRIILNGGFDGNAHFSSLIDAVAFGEVVGLRLEQLQSCTTADEASEVLTQYASGILAVERLLESPVDRSEWGEGFAKEVAAKFGLDYQEIEKVAADTEPTLE